MAKHASSTNVVQLPRRPRPAPPEIERTPELALILALYGAMTKAQRLKVNRSLFDWSSRAPDDQNIRAALRFADRMYGAVS